MTLESSNIHTNINSILFIYNEVLLKRFLSVIVKMGAKNTDLEFKITFQQLSVKRLSLLSCKNNVPSRVQGPV